MRTVRAPLAVGVVLALAATAVADTPRADRPTYTVGERWIRSDGAYRLDRIENGYYVFLDDRVATAPAMRREVWIAADSLGLAMARRGDAFFRLTPPPRLEWPLQVGRGGVGRTRVQTQKTPAGGVDAAFSWSVAAVEDISIAGQTLETFRIEWAILLAPGYRVGGARGFGAGRGGGPGSGIGRMLHYRQWYAPSVRQIVRSQSDRIGLFNFQVVAFDRPAEPGLTIALDGVPDGARVTSQALTVRGHVAGGRGIERVSVTLNGAETWAAGAPGAPRSEVSLAVPLRLRDGRNVILVTATDVGGHTRQASRVITVERPTAAPAPAMVAPRVTLTSPRDQARIEQPSITLAGIADGPGGVSRVVVTLNGAEAARLGDGTAKPAVAVTVPLTLREGANTIVVTATDPAGRVQQEVRTVEYDKILPLSVAFRYPDNGAHVSEDASVVAAVASSSRGVAAVSVSLNGVEVAKQRPSTPQKSVVVAVPVTLKPGANAVLVTAAEPDGTRRQDVRTIVYEPQKVVAVARPGPAMTLPSKSEQWAVIVGVGKYDNPSVPALRYSVADARAMYDTLRHTGVPADHIVLLTDDSDKKPTLRNVKWALGTFLGRSAKKDDTVIMYYAGHGAPEVDTRGLERDGLAKYLVPSDADPEDLYATALPMDELQTIFGRIEADRVVAFLDACYSGAAGGRTFLSKRTRAGSIDDLFLERLTRSKGRAIVTASRPSEVSIELPELGHGVFTYYLVQGLRGAADLNHDGIVSLEELYEYVEQQVSAKSRAVGGNQHPVMKGELEGVLPLAKVQ